MIKGFNKQTQRLTKYEIDTIMPIIVNSLQRSFGKRAAIKNGEIANILIRNGYNIAAPRIRKIINHIRLNAIIPNLVASANGYYIANTLEEAEDYIESLRNREEAIKAVRLAMEEQLYAV